MSRKVNGRVAEAAVLKHYASLDYDVFIGFTDNNKTDIVVADSTGLKAVSVKYTSTPTPSGKWNVELRQVYRGGDGIVSTKFDASSTDLLAVYIGPEDRVVVIDAKPLDGKSCVVVS